MEETGGIYDIASNVQFQESLIDAATHNIKFSVLEQFVSQSCVYVKIS